MPAVISFFLLSLLAKSTFFFSPPFFPFSSKTINRLLFHFGKVLCIYSIYVIHKKHKALNFSVRWLHSASKIFIATAMLLLDAVSAWRTACLEKPISINLCTCSSETSTVGC